MENNAARSMVDAALDEDICSNLGLVRMGGKERQSKSGDWGRERESVRKYKSIKK